ncbi:MAG: hypothetical protein JRD19_05325 [Deltaproteobacteria bacterium]|jgi:uncharacterized protein (TIGR00661 family)|nr:hypothetical protein [Deltaproteobacteria bacterium]
MNILYGVQGTGNGHISRSREIILQLKSMGHHVDVILSGRAPEAFWDMEDFKPYKAYRGLTFITHKGKIDYTKTAMQLNLPQLYSDIRSYQTNGLDLVVTDFEPIAARIAKKHKIPCLGIGHQYAFYHDIPFANGNFVARYIIRNYAPAEIPIGLHWHHFNQPILPPIIPTTLNSATPRQEPHKVLVYLPFEALTDIISLIHSFEYHNFFIYHDVKEADDIGNLHIRPFSRQGFLQDLEECTYVISSAGFELISEALILGKKILVKPLEGQMEQYSNALAIRELNLGMDMNTLDKEIVGEFLESSDAKTVNYPDVALLIAQWLKKGQWHDVASLAKECWSLTN